MRDLNEPITFYRDQLSTCTGTLIWAARQVPTGRWFVQPLPVFGEWPAARQVFHVTWSDRYILLPHLRQWAGGPSLTRDSLPDQQANWQAAAQQSPAVLLADFEEVRTAQITLLDQFQDGDLQATRPTFWGEVSLAWMLARIVQHTLEHTSSLMSMALFWDYHIERAKQQRKAERETGSTDDNASSDG